MCEVYPHLYGNKMTSDGVVPNQSLDLDLPSLSTINSSVEKHKYVTMPQSPEISRSFNSKLHLSGEIEETINNDGYFKYVVYNIFNLIEGALTSEFAYSVDAEYVTRDESFMWRQANILVTVYNTDFDTSLALWMEVGDKIEEFFKGLITSSKNIWPANKVEQLLDLISIEFESSD